MLEYIIQSTPLSVGLGFITLVLLWCLYINRDRNTPPGPFAFPIVGNLNVFMSNGGNVLKTFRDLRTKYGDLYSLRMGSADVVVVNGYENLKELLLKKGDEVSDRPNSFIFKEILKGEGLAGSSGSLWKTHRTFALTTLRNFGFGKRNIESRIMEEVTPFLQSIESRNGKPFDLDGLIQTSVSNIICSIVFGQRFEYNDKSLTKLIGLFDTNIRLAGPSALISVFPFLKYVPGDPCNGKLILNNADKIFGFLGELVAEHRKTYNEDNIRDYIDAYIKEQRQNRDTFTGNADALLNTVFLNNGLHFGMRGRQEHTDLLWGDIEMKADNSTGQQYLEFNERLTKTRKGDGNIRAFSPKMFAIPDSQLVKSIADLFSAGTETTATTIKWTMLYLLYNDEVQRRMRKEIDDVIGTSRPPSLNDRNSLPYCEAVITEVLRCGNIVPLSVQHACQQDVAYRGYSLKKGTIIIPNLDSVLYDPNVFKNPEKFDPERFLDANGKLQGQEKMISFSIGRRVCLGESLARSELFLFLTSMIQRFRFVAKDENNLPPLEGILGITYSPKRYEFCAIKRV